MSRLNHSTGGLIRSFQISRRHIRIIVEGPTDRAIISRILRHHSALSGIEYRITMSRELQHLGEGKNAMKKLYWHCLRNRKLVSSLSGQRTAMAFCFDKDTDDLRNKRLRSQHVVYSEHYSIENYLYREGALHESLSAAAQFDLGSVQSHIPYSAVEWCHRRACHWAEWISYCLLAARIEIRCANYSLHTSGFHDSPCGPLNHQRQASLEQIALSNSGLSADDFLSEYDRAKATVARLLKRRHLDLVFNGKWYGSILADEAKRLAAGSGYKEQKLPDALQAALISSLDVTAAWTDRYVKLILFVATLVPATH